MINIENDVQQRHGKNMSNRDPNMGLSQSIEDILYPKPYTVSGLGLHVGFQTHSAIKPMAILTTQLYSMKTNDRAPSSGFRVYSPL